uniref:Putative glycine-rich cell wall structural protein 1.0 n=2 Tax=Nyssomyia neivai TaxID=330878 RepID=A0A1L8E3I5_9DIPT
MGRISYVVFLAVVLNYASALPYSKYGRSCSDIGCLSSEVCVMASDSCSYGQRENKDCGRYPTCRKSGAAGGSTGPGGYLNPLPDNTRISTGQDQSPNFNGNPNYQPPPYGSNNYPPPQQPYPGNYPAPNYYPQNPQYPQPQYPQPGYQQPYPGQRPPNFYNPQHTTEPSLWHQFLYNKSSAHSHVVCGNSAMALIFTAILTFALRNIN